MSLRVLAALVLCLGLTACEERVLSGRPALTREQLLDPETCKTCHPRHYAEWFASMHAYATRDPVFRAMNQRGQEETQGELGPFCARCHAPMAVRENAIADFADLSSVPRTLQGVTCYFCHNAVGLGPEHDNAAVELADDNTMRANLPRALIPSVHQVKRSALHDGSRMESSLLCGTCHDIVTPAGLHLERTLTEWENSVQSKNDLEGQFQSCQSCHMRERNALAAAESGIPGVSTHQRTVHEHLFAAVDVPLTDDAPHAAALRSALEQCELPGSIGYFQVVPEQLGRIKLLFETQAGHRQPSGAAQDRRMWYEVDGFDADGKLIYSAGKIADDALEPADHPCLLRDEVLDEAGQPTHMFWRAAQLKQAFTIPEPSTSLAGSHTQQCSFAPPSPQPMPQLEVRLRLRPMGLDVLADLVGSGHLAPDIPARMPTFTVETRRLHYDASRNEYIDDAPKQDVPCEYPQLLGDSGAGAAGSGGP